MSALAEIVAALLLVVGGIFGVVGSWGLVRLPDPMTRLHAPTKAATLGVGSVLLGSMLFFWFVKGEATWHELLITIFIFATAPVTGMFIAKAHMHLSWDRRELPRPPRDDDWATFGDSALESPMVRAPDQLPRSE